MSALGKQVKSIHVFPLTVLLCFLALIALPFLVIASDEKESVYPDKFGREALRIWQERERQRQVSDAVNRYWDYWFTRQPRQYPAFEIWYKLKQTQSWLKDPDKHPPLLPGCFRLYLYDSPRYPRQSR